MATASLVVVWTNKAEMDAAADALGAMAAQCAHLGTLRAVIPAAPHRVEVVEDGRRLSPAEVNGELLVKHATTDETAGDVDDEQGTTAPARALTAEELALVDAARAAGYVVTVKLTGHRAE